MLDEEQLCESHVDFDIPVGPLCFPVCHSIQHCLWLQQFIRCFAHVVVFLRSQSVRFTVSKPGPLSGCVAAALRCFAVFASLEAATVLKPVSLFTAMLRASSGEGQ